jgi:predicted nucleic-acid-binding Zn-ribbon protein
MSLIKAKCIFCGNTNIREFVEYDGTIGYEAIICKKCGGYSDHYGHHEPDEFSKRFIGDKCVIY